MIVTHFQKLFHVPSQAGVIARMSEVCSRLEEFSNVMQSIKDSLGLGQSTHMGHYLFDEEILFLFVLEPEASSAAVMKRLNSLTEAFQQEDGYDRLTWTHDPTQTEPEVNNVSLFSFPPRVQAKLQQYEEFIPAFQGLVTKLLSILGNATIHHMCIMIGQILIKTNFQMFQVWMILFLL